MSDIQGLVWGWRGIVYLLAGFGLVGAGYWVVL